MERMEVNLRETVAQAIYDHDQDDDYAAACHRAAVALIALGLDDWDALRERGASELSDQGVWVYRELGRETFCTPREIAQAVLEGAFARSATEGADDGAR